MFAKNDHKKIGEMIREKYRVDVDVSEDDANPVIVGSISLSQFGVMGFVMVYMDSKKNYHAIGVPYGFGMDDKSHFEEAS